MPLEYRVYKTYINKGGKYKTTKRRKTAEEFEGISPSDVKRIVKKHKRNLKRREIHKAKKVIAKNQEKIKKIKEKGKKVDKHNKKILNKLSNIKEKQDKLLEKKIKSELEQGFDARVVIKFDEIPEIDFNKKITGSLKFFYSQQFPIKLKKEDFYIAKKKGKIKVLHGNLEKAFKNIFES